MREKLEGFNNLSPDCMFRCVRADAGLGVSVRFNRSKMEATDRRPHLWKDLTLQIQFGMQITALPRARAKGKQRLIDSERGTGMAGDISAIQSPSWAAVYS